MISNFRSRLFMELQGKFVGSAQSKHPLTQTYSHKCGKEQWMHPKHLQVNSHYWGIQFEIWEPLCAFQKFNI